MQRRTHPKDSTLLPVNHVHPSPSGKKPLPVKYNPKDNPDENEDKYPSTQCGKKPAAAGSVLKKYPRLLFLGLSILVLTLFYRFETDPKYRFGNVSIPKEPLLPTNSLSQGTSKKTKRTSEEATRIMLSRPWTNVQGEIQLKKKLLEIYQLQHPPQEEQQTKKKQQQNIQMYEKAKIVTRWLGEDIQYWMLKDDTNRTWWEKEIRKRKTEWEEREKKEGWYHKPVKRDSPTVDSKDNTVIQDRTDDEKREEPEGNSHALWDPRKEEENRKDWNVGDVSSSSSATTADVNTTMLSPTVKYDPLPPTALAGLHAKIILQPTFGRHRSNQDAIFALAEGYDLSTYLGFIESLRETGYQGDVVLSVSSIDTLSSNVREYLEAQQQTDGLNIVVYTIHWQCFLGRGNGQNLTETDGAGGGVNWCIIKDFYGRDIEETNQEGEETLEVLEDPRTPRPVATARYELYWSWSLHYEPDSWIMLIDSRDTYFQLNPFAYVPRSKGVNVSAMKEDEGRLYLFGENKEASTIGNSSFNRNWLVSAYGLDHVRSYLDNAILCSGSTMGEQAAIEAYTRAMIAQFDDTKCRSKGCDQGFHNYIYYSNYLNNTRGISEVYVFEQGRGIINNLALLRSKSLREWGLIQEGSNFVLNWDQTPSAVAHQLDRDNELNSFFKKRKREYEKAWAASRGKV